MAKERRFRRVYFDPQLIVGILNWCHEPTNRIMRLPSNCELPEDTVVEYIYSEPAIAGLYCVVSHPSFDPVPVGMCIPEHPPVTELEYRTFEKVGIKALGGE